jgi:hypothetical protein
LFGPQGLSAALAHSEQHQLGIPGVAVSLIGQDVHAAAAAPAASAVAAGRLMQGPLQLKMEKQVQQWHVEQNQDLWQQQSQQVEQQQRALLLLRQQQQQQREQWECQQQMLSRMQHNLVDLQNDNRLQLHSPLHTGGQVEQQQQGHAMIQWQLQHERLATSESVMCHQSCNLNQ